MSQPPPPPPPTVPDPKLDATDLSSTLPHSQLENLRYKITQIMESIGNLIVTLNTPGGGVGGGLAGWPELMTKYNVLLSKTHSLAASLGAPPTRKGQISLKQIVPHPFAVDGTGPNATPTPTPALPGSQPTLPGSQPPPPAPTGLDPQLDAMLDALLDGRRAPSVLKNDVNNVARLHVSEGDELGARLDEIKRTHDARCARGVEAVRQLKDKYDWKSRLLFDDSESSSGSTVAESDTSVHAEPNGQEDEDMVEVAPDEPVDPGMDTEEGTPTHTVFVPAVEDSDSSGDEEEVQVQVQVPVVEEMEESESEEEVFVEPANEPEPVSALEGLWAIDP